MNLYSKLKSNWWSKNIIEIVVILSIVVAVRTFIFGLYQVPSGSMETTLLVGERFLADKLTLFFKPIERGEIIAFNDPTYDYSTNPIKNIYERYFAFWGVQNWTKRVIGIPGDYIKGRVEDGKPVIYLNGKKLDEPYVNKYPLIYMYREGLNVNDPTLENIEARSFDPLKPLDKQPFYNINPNNIVPPKDLRPGLGKDVLIESKFPAVLLEPNIPARNGFDIYTKKLGENEYWVMGDNRLNSKDSRYFGALDGSLIHGRIVFRLFSIDTEYSWLIWDIIRNPISFWSKIRWSRCLNWVDKKY